MAEDAGELRPWLVELDPPLVTGEPVHPLVVEGVRPDGHASPVEVAELVLAEEAFSAQRECLGEEGAWKVEPVSSGRVTE